MGGKESWPIIDPVFREKVTH